MKTKEFIERLSALGYSTSKYEDTIEVLEMVTPSYGRIYGRIHRKEPYRIEKTQYARQDPRVFDLMVEYARTPLDEREEEKKYYVEFGDKLDKLSKNRYLNLNITNNVFFFHFNWLDLEDFDSGHLKFKGKFTQSEIDNFPPEIKGAIECGFLKKVEVYE